MDKKVILTYEGLKNLEDELKILKGEKRKEIAERIKEARSQGDLSENAEYDAAKDEQARIEGRIMSIEKMLGDVEVIKESDIDSGIISLGSTVTILDLEFNEELVYQIVGAAESNPEKNRISNESPLGNGLIGQKEGDTIDIDAPMGIIKYKIISIS